MPTKPVKKEAAPKVTYPAPTVDEKAILTKAAALTTEISSLVVRDQESYATAGQIRGRLQEYIKWLDSFYGPIKSAINLAVKTLKDSENKIIGPRKTSANALLEDLNTKMSNFLIAEEKRAKEEARIEQERKDKEAAAERAKLEKKAAKAEEKGKGNVAEQLREQAAQVTAAPVVVKQAVSFAGTGTTAKDDIAFTITDLWTFLTWAHDYHKKDISTLADIKYNETKKFIKSLPNYEELKPESVGVKVEVKKIIVKS